nr:TPA_asm: hypothetical protein HUJ06_001737 [Nelumbo nucifera]
MGIKKSTHLFITFIFTTFLFASLFFIQGYASRIASHHHQGLSHLSQSLNELNLKGVGGEWWMKNSRRLMIGSTAPVCTYNECRGCKFKCRAEQIPVDANDPINSAYHYRCVCHR